MLQLPVQSVSITTKVVSSNPIQAGCTRYNIMWIKFVSDLWQVGGFLLVLRFSPPIKLAATIQLKYCLKWCWMLFKDVIQNCPRSSFPYYNPNTHHNVDFISAVSYIIKFMSMRLRSLDKCDVTMFGIEVFYANLENMEYMEICCYGSKVILLIESKG